jgi:hypothetical protein
MIAKVRRLASCSSSCDMGTGQQAMGNPLL